MSQQTAFNSAWLKEGLFSQWLARRESNKHKERCKVCGINFELSKMGKQELISHSKGKKPTDKMKLLTEVQQEQPSLKSFFVCEAKSDTTDVENAETPSTERLIVPVPPEDTHSCKHKHC